jgi:hypothetical protein
VVQFALPTTWCNAEVEVVKDGVPLRPAGKLHAPSDDMDGEEAEEGSGPMKRLRKSRLFQHSSIGPLLPSLFGVMSFYKD